MRIFLDANILFSAARSDGAIRHLLNTLLKARHSCWVDEYVIAEARRNLHLKHADALAEFDAMMRKLSVSDARAPLPPVDVRWLPEKDRPVLLAAMRSRCDALVTGDRRHFGIGFGKTFGGVTLHSPRSLAETLGLD
ncbi:MAG: PIN domain-containing protein [Xanthomonadaceae bacterium]|nr:PIN domain-containing protein [Xanthomonadaceae bacterium]MDE2084887.1 PIN domain-containing protein [Xanthomonadaceae bacterium]MDE2256474.1 PIN domain-containing protein [Xanthomonadaceae bacterium]